MDTALFFPAYLDLSPNEAHKQVGSIIENALRFGGSVTVNWHDRSIAPERLWGDFYVELVDELKEPRSLVFDRLRRSLLVSQTSVGSF